MPKPGNGTVLGTLGEEEVAHVAGGCEKLVLIIAGSRETETQPVLGTTQVLIQLMLTALGQALLSPHFTDEEMGASGG